MSRDVLSLTLLILAFASCNTEIEKYSEALSPEEELLTFNLDDKFKIEVFASEPLVEEPVEMTMDENGIIYVVEMADYAEEDSAKGRGRIKVLQDKNGNGQIDDYIIFCDSLKEATSIQPWNGGLLVAAAPYIYFFKDTTGDFKADQKEILFDGFFTNNPDAQITSLRFNVDNWIYALNYGQPGEISFNRDKDSEKLQIQGADFRFRLDRNLFEKETGPGQFGLALNNYGHRFVTANTTHIQEPVIPWRYLHRHQLLESTKAIIDISDHGLELFQESQAPYWRVERSARRQAAFDEKGLDRKEYADKHFTGASGGTYYGGDLFPKEYQGNVFTGEVATNLVHRDVISLPNSQSYHLASRAPAEMGKEFLTSADPWFRPANFFVGPDGSLYIVDMYRQHIEAPFSVPDDLREDMDYLKGEKKGRIFRITPKSSNTEAIPKDVTNKKMIMDYVTWLDNPNQWYRLQAQRVIIASRDNSVKEAVEQIFQQSKFAPGRLSAFYVLEGLNALDINLILEALKDEDNGIKQHAIMAAESYPGTINSLLALKDDPSAKIVLQTALSLGEFKPSNEIKVVLSEILMNHYTDYFIRLAVLSSKAGTSLELINSLLNKNFFENIDEDKLKLASQLGYSFGARTDQNAQMKYCNLISKQPKSFIESTVKGFYKGVEKSQIGLSNELISILNKLDFVD